MIIIADDFIIPPDRWPAFAQRWLLTPDLPRNQRWAFFLFLTWNGVPDTRAADYVSYYFRNDLHHLITERESNIRRHVADLLRYAQGTPDVRERRLLGYKVWDLQQGRFI